LTVSAIGMMKQARRIKSRRHYRLLRGRFEKALRLAGLSESLRDSAMREFNRQATRSGSRDRY
jgi:hypothetical protein